MAEDPIKGGDAFETGLEGNFCDRQVRIGQQSLCPSYSLHCQIFYKVIAGEPLEGSGKIAGTEIHVFGHTFQG